MSTPPSAAPDVADLDLAAIDLADPATHCRADIDDVWRRLRTEAPLHHQPDSPEGRGFWVLSRYDDVLDLYKDSHRFRSGPGNMLESLRKPEGDPAAGEVLFMMDAPEHQPLRNVLRKSLTPAIRQGVVDRLAARVAALITERIGGGRFDFAEDVADKVPIWTICELLGMPEEDRPRLLELSRDALSAASTDQSPEDRWATRTELLDYCARALEDKRDEPADDLLSAMAAAEVDGVPLTDQQIILNCYGLLLAGDHTSRLGMISAVERFGSRPDLLRGLREGSVPPAAAVEEIIRWTSPVQHVGRTAAEDFDLHGRRIRSGDIVTAWNISANRDETAFPQADVFVPDRTPNRHLGLGSGPHFCLGAFLGRAEIGAVLTVLRDRVGGIELCGPPQPIYSTFLRGFRSLSVALR
ncbi:cytochrome P450 [Streptomyces sp. NPDC088801]|uniref:cytochrome P450 n=1 Tax=Streptomyces sp. NPDC088801 TaxID=3365903 RepID=UPI00381F0552